VVLGYIHDRNSRMREIIFRGRCECYNDYLKWEKAKPSGRGAQKQEDKQVQEPSPDVQTQGRGVNSYRKLKEVEGT
jgi:hypothetical protein